MSNFLRTIKIMQEWIAEDNFAELVKQRENLLSKTGGKQGFQIVNNLQLEWKQTSSALRAYIGVPELAGWYIEDDRNGAGNPWTLYSPSGSRHDLNSGLPTLLFVLEQVLDTPGEKSA